MAAAQEQSPTRDPNTGVFQLGAQENHTIAPQGADPGDPGKYADYASAPVIQLGANRNGPSNASEKPIKFRLPLAGYHPIDFVYNPPYAWNTPKFTVPSPGNENFISANITLANGRNGPVMIVDNLTVWKANAAGYRQPYAFQSRFTVPVILPQ